MKKSIALIFAVILVFSSTFGALVSSNSAVSNKASDLYFTLGKSGKKVSLLELTTMTADQLQTVTGKKMNIFEKLSFKVAQRKLKKMIKEDGTVDMKTFEKLTSPTDVEQMTKGFNIGGFALGFFLTFIGVIIAYLIDGKGSSLVKWAWIGAACSAVIYILLAIF